MSALLIDGRFVAVFPRLVKALNGDVTAAAVLQAIHYRTQAFDHRGQQWMPMLLSEIGDEIGISFDQAQRASRRLRDAGLLSTRGPVGTIKEWRIEYGAVEQLERGHAISQDPEPSRNRDTTVAESQHPLAESRHNRREIATPTVLIEGLETKELQEDRCTRTPVLKPVDNDPHFAEFWQVYPRRTAKGSARRAWARAVKDTKPDLIIAGAKRYAEDPNREDTYTAHPSTWLNAERWLDEPLPPRDGRAGRKTTEVTDMIRRAAERDAARGKGIEQ